MKYQTANSMLKQPMMELKILVISETNYQSATLKSEHTAFSIIIPAQPMKTTDKKA